MPFHDKKSKEKQEELPLNSILYSDYLTRNQQVKNCGLVAITNNDMSVICAFVIKW